MAFNLESMLYSVPAVIVGLTVHEFAHAFTAWKLGDETAKSQGRVSLNPLKHLDPFGMLFIIIAGFGWAKPVQFNPENLKHPRRDRILISLSGPFSNLVLGVVAALIIKMILAFASAGIINSFVYVFNFLLYFVYINFGLFVFNMLPIPPLDGSHVIFQGLKLKPELEAKIYRYGMYALLVIILAEQRFKIDILPIGKVVEFMAGIFF